MNVFWKRKKKLSRGDIVVVRGDFYHTHKDGALGVILSHEKILNAYGVKVNGCLQWVHSSELVRVGRLNKELNPEEVAQ
jgi:hypothetical protein